MNVSKKYRTLGFLLILLLSVMLGSAFVTSKAQVINQESTSTVNWMTFEEAVEQSKIERRKIFIDVYTDWCGWCKVMDRKTFSEASIAAYLNEKYYPVKFDAEQEDEVSFNDHTFKFVPNGRRGYHELAVTLLQGKLSYPTVVFLDEDFNMIQPLPGYREPKDFHPILQYFGEDQYKVMKWDEFQAKYESPYN